MHATPFEDKRGHDFEKHNGSVWEGCREEGGVRNYVIIISKLKENVFKNPFYIAK